jgi:hypothetical protein
MTKADRGVVEQAEALDVGPNPPKSRMYLRRGERVIRHIVDCPSEGLRETSWLVVPTKMEEIAPSTGRLEDAGHLQKKEVTQ